MLRSIDKNDFTGRGKIEEGDLLDWKLCSSDELSDDEETEQFDDTQPIDHAVDLQTTDTNFVTHSALCFDDDSGSGATESSKGQEKRLCS